MIRRDESLAGRSCCPARRSAFMLQATKRRGREDRVRINPILYATYTCTLDHSTQQRSNERLLMALVSSLTFITNIALKTSSVRWPGRMTSPWTHPHHQSMSTVVFYMLPMTGGLPTSKAKRPYEYPMRKVLKKALYILSTPFIPRHSSHRCKPHFHRYRYRIVVHHRPAFHAVVIHIEKRFPPLLHCATK